MTGTQIVCISAKANARFDTVRLAEIVGVGVLAAYLRRHVASATAAALTEAVFTTGAIPYLQTETVNEERVYGSFGYMTVGHLTAKSLP